MSLEPLKPSTTRAIFAMEGYFTADGPAVFFCGVKLRADRHGSFIAAMALTPQPSTLNRAQP
jgi:hypothetical protein